MLQRRDLGPGNYAVKISGVASSKGMRAHVDALATSSTWGDSGSRPDGRRGGCCTIGPSRRPVTVL